MNYYFFIQTVMIEICHINDSCNHSLSRQKLGTYLLRLNDYQTKYNESIVALMTRKGLYAVIQISLF
jgi:hypothetical protein